MSNNFDEQDPFWKIGKQAEQQRLDEMMRNLQRGSELERAIQKRLGRFLRLGLPQLLWKHSRPTVLLFVAPFWIFIAIVAAVTIAIRTIFPYNVGFYGFGLIFFGLMVASLIFGFRKTVGFQRIIATLQITVASLFTCTAIYRALNAPEGTTPFEPKTLECAVAIIAMGLLFGIAAYIDLIRSFWNRHEQE